VRSTCTTRFTRSTLWLPALLLLSACVSFPPYQPAPEDAFLVERTDVQNPREKSDASGAFALSVDHVDISNRDRVRIPNPLGTGRDIVALKLSPGKHRIAAQACESGWAVNCGKAYLEITALAGHYYGIYSKISKANDYMDMWVVEMRSGETVAGPVRVRGLTKRYF